jgi:hypothetical protein
LRSCARAPRRIYRMRRPSRSAWLSFADQPQLLLDLAADLRVSAQADSPGREASACR